MNNEDFCSYDLSLRLKQAGFDRPCCNYYSKENSSDGFVWITTSAFIPEDWNNGRNADHYLLTPLCSAPTLAQAQKWLREIHNIHVLPHLESVNRPQYVCHITQLRKSSERLTDDVRYFDTYESALSAGIEAALKLIENNKAKES